MGTSLPYPSPAAQADPATERMARVDGCPEACGNTEPPRDVKPTATGYMAAYLCSDCGHAWMTSWKDD